MKMTAADLRSLTLRSAGPLLAGLIGFVWFVRWAGWQVLDPTYVSWLLTGDDWTPHFLGWAFFRNESLGFPLGELDGLLHPLGTTLGYVDANPLVSLLLRPFSAILPRPFQFIGPWIALCSVLQGVTGAWLAGRFTRNPALQMLAGGLLATSPLLITRAGHDTLCAHWLLVVLIGLHCSSLRTPGETRGAFLWAAVWTAVAAAIHPYLAAMTFALAVGLVWRLASMEPLRARAPASWQRRIGTGVVGTALLTLVALSVFGLLGYFSGGVTTTATGFGAHTSDLYSLINPRGQSRFLRDLPSARTSYEGWGFLGSGVLLLAGVALVSLIVRHRETLRLPWKRIVPLVLVTAGLTLLALGNEVNLGASTLLRLDFLFEPLAPLTATFRASGRFIWVAHYVVAAGAIALLIRIWGAGDGFDKLTLNGSPVQPEHVQGPLSMPIVPFVLLLIALVVQWVDFDWKGAHVFRRGGFPVLSAEAWQQAASDYDHLVLVPPQVVYAPAPCGGELPGASWVLFGELAARLGFTINSGYVARYDATELVGSCKATLAQVESGALDPSSVYVLSAARRRRTKWSPGAVQCGVLEGFNVCVASERDTPLRRLLAESAP